MPNANKSVTWDKLLDSIATGATHPDDTNWKIFRYLQHNYKTMGSVTVRTLLAAYMKLHVKRMSLVDSCMLHGGEGKRDLRRLQIVQVS